MTNETKLTAVEWLEQQTRKPEWHSLKRGEIFEQAKEMEKEQRGYSKKDVLKAGELGEINHIDTKHIVSCLDEAKQHNETYGGNK
jgi:hypothetical protein